MNCLVSTSVLIIFAILSNCYLGSGSMTKKSNSELKNWENEGQRKEVADYETALDRRQEESWQLDGGENLNGQDEIRTEMTQRTENEGRLLNDTQENEPGMESAEQDKNSLVTGKVRLIRVQRSKHNRSNRKRHNRKLKEEIEELHSEMRHVIADLDEISERENELEVEIDELRQNRKMRGKQIKTKDSNVKQHLEIHLPPVKNHKHHDSHSDPTDHDFGFVETEIQDLDDEDAGSESTLLAETEVPRKDSREVFRKNNELRRKNKELCKLLHLSLIEQMDIGAIQGNGDFYEQLDKLSSETGESLVDQFLHACGRSYRGNKTGHSKNPKLHSSEDVQKNGEPEGEDARKKDAGYGGKATRVNKKAGKRGRQSPKTLSAYQDSKESIRQSHDHDSKTRKSERKLHKIKLSDEVEAEEEIMLANDKIETGETSSRLGSDEEDQTYEKSEGSISSAFKGLEKEEEEEEEGETLATADYGKYSEDEEEEANMTISTDDGDKQKVYDHISSVDEIAFCDKPRPVVIYPSDQYPVPKKYYTPQGTILHRCSKHSGCCPNEQLTCVPAKKENVILHFFAAILEGSSTIVPHIEKLRFVNHTKCGCVFKHRAHLYL